MTSLNSWMAEVKDRLEKATPGPWLACTKRDHADIFYIHPDDGSSYLSPLEMATLYRSGNDFAKEDATLIARAPTDLLRALKVIEVLLEGLFKIDDDPTVGCATERIQCYDVAREALTRAEEIANE